MEPESIVKTSIKKGLNAIAITDHNTIKGSLEAKKIRQDKLYIIIGSEILTNKGEVIGLFLKNEIKSRNYDEVLKEIRIQRGLIMLPHPFRTFKYNISNYAMDFDLVEILNARNTRNQNDKAKLLTRKFNKIPVSGSDAHFPQEIGRVKSIIDTNDHYLSGGLKDILLNEKIINQGNELPLVFNALGKGMGFMITKVKGFNERSSNIR